MVWCVQETTQNPNSTLHVVREEQLKMRLVHCEGKLRAMEKMGLRRLAYRRWTGKRSLVLRTSREFHPTMDTPLKTQERMTITLSCFGMPQIRNVLTAEIMMDEAM